MKLDGTPPRAILAWEEAYGLISGRWSTESHCINGTRVTIDALSRFGIRALPVSCLAIAMNSVWLDRLSEHEGFPASKEQSDEWKAAGGYCVGIDPDPETGGYPGHLVCYAKGFLLDSSSGQFSRPQHNMPVPPCLYVPVPRNWHLSTKNVWMSNDTTTLSYLPVPNERRYLQAPGWGRTDANREMTAALIDGIARRMREVA